MSQIQLLETKRASEAGTFSGYASTFGNEDHFGDVIEKGAFSMALRRHKSQNTVPGLLWHHDQTEPIGKWLDLREDDHGLRVTGRLTLGTKRGAEAHALMKDSAVDLSIGFQVDRNGAKQQKNVRVITRIARLAEISVVALPANPQAKILSTKAERPPVSLREFQRLLQGAAGFSSLEAKRLALGGWDSLVLGERGSDVDRVLEAVEQLRNDIIR